MSVFTDVLQIPVQFEPLFLSMRQIAFLFVLPLLVIALLQENLAQVGGRGNYSGLFVRILVILGLLIVYNPFFELVTHGMDLLSKTIMPDDAFNEVLQNIFHEIQENKDFGVFNLFKGAIITAATYVTYFLTYVAYTVLIWLRFILLSLLYVIGPILVVFGIYEQLSGVLASWLKSLFEVSAWIVTLSLLVRIASFMNLTSIYNLDESNAVLVVTANVLFVLLFIFTPAITSSILSRSSIGTVGSSIIGIATVASHRFSRRMRSGRSNFNQGNKSQLNQNTQNEE